MPIQPTYPGVYIQEKSSGVRTITGVSTSIAVFFGRTQRGPVDEAVRCLGYSDFLRKFGAGHPKSDLRASVKQFFDNGGTDCYVVRVTASGAVSADATIADSAGPTDIMTVTAKNAGAWGNNIQFETTDNGDGTFSMTVSEVDGTTVLSSEPTYIKLSLDPTSPRYVEDYVSQRSDLVDVEVLNLPAVFDSTTGPQDGTYFLGVAPPLPLVVSADQTGMTQGLDDDGVTPLATTDYTNPQRAFDSLERVDLFNLMVIPGDEDLGEAGYQTLLDPASVICENRRAFLLVDAPETNWTSAAGIPVAGKTEVDGLRVGMSTKYSAVFYPKIRYNDGGILKSIGPSAMVAGIMARTDSQRGVWKAPAGIDANLRLVDDVFPNLTDNENGVLNKMGVNCIRKFPNGIVNWGARTLDGDDDFGSEWKYIPIRRLALFIEESLFRGTKWVVFEPNDEPLWAMIRMNLNAFMMSLFRQGAFQGSTPDKAFFVKCDGETTTANDRNLGIVNIVVGFAPLKPAEFVIITIQQIPDV